jgi:hypothetical protein
VIVHEHALQRAKVLQVPMSLVRAAARCADGTDVAVCMGVTPFMARDREQWVESDVLAAIVRQGVLVTILATRKGQVNKSHLRVERIVWA